MKDKQEEIDAVNIQLIALLISNRNYFYLYLPYG